MDALEPMSFQCPYCGEQQDTFVDCSAGSRDYIDDCQICCRPIEMVLTIDDEGEASLFVHTDSD